MTTLDAPAEYVAARRVLLDALSALEPHRHALILVGAQAIYVRTGNADFDAAIAPYTTDADIAIDPRLLGSDPQIDEAMKNAGFTLARPPGVWETRVTLGDRSLVVPVDLLVPDVLAGPGRRAARLKDQPGNVARRTSGLEAVLADHSVVRIKSMDPNDPREFDALVAGVAALFIAKAHKLAERLAENPPKRVQTKDASDLYRLMQVERAYTVARRLRQLRLDVVAGPAVETGVRHIVDLFRRRESPGVRVAVDALAAGGVPGDTVRAVMTAYANELADVYIDLED
jgi:hypothetical protein